MTDSITDWTSDEFAGIVLDPQEIAMHKHIFELTIDEAIQYRAGDFFPTDDEKRNNMIHIRVDSKFRRALKVISHNHYDMTKSNNRFIIVALGSRIIINEYRDEILIINNRYKEINDNPDDDAFSRIDRCVAVQQEGTIIKIRMGFAQGEYDLLTDMAEELGLTHCALIVYCFWFAAITSADLPYHLLEYGEKMKMKFKKHLQSRIYELQFRY